MTDGISIQSQVVYGHVGNSAAVFPMQAKGLDVAAVPTTLLSNHPHYPSIYGCVLQPELLADLLQGVEDRGLPVRAKAIVSGYLGSADNGHVVADFVGRAQHSNPGLLYVCDPVMGDDDLGLFVTDGLPELFRERLAPLASVLTPNQYELELLAGTKARTASDLQAAMEILAGRGTGAAAVTGCVLADTPEGHVETIAWAGEICRRTAVRRLPIRPYGTGDLFTALLVARLCAGMQLAEASEGATNEIFALLLQMAAEDVEEMPIIGFPFARSCGET